MNDGMNVFWMILVVAGVTAAIRFLPFALFRKKAPALVTELGALLPAAIMAMLVVYCLRNTSFTGATHGLPEAVSVAVTALLHKWRHNTLLSILAGTLLYMLLVQTL